MSGKLLKLLKRQPMKHAFGRHIRSTFKIIDRSFDDYCSVADLANLTQDERVGFEGECATIMERQILGDTHKVFAPNTNA